jgi:uncharacterized metal-binding protein
VGQIANRVAVDLTVEGRGKMFCLAGIGGDLSGFIQSARDCPQVLVIDGCPAACGQKGLERAGIHHFAPLVVTDLGIEKNKDYRLKEEEIQPALNAARLKCEGLALRSLDTGVPSSQPSAGR